MAVSRIFLLHCYRSFGNGGGKSFEDLYIVIATVFEDACLNVVITFVGIVIDGLQARLAHFVYLDVVVGALVVVLKDIANVGGKSEAHVAVNL